MLTVVAATLGAIAMTILSYARFRSRREDTWRRSTAGFLMITIAGSLALTRLLSHVPPPPPAFTPTGLIAGLFAVVGGYIVLRERYRGRPR